MILHTKYTGPRDNGFSVYGYKATPGPNAGVQLPANSVHPGRLVFMGASNNTGSTCALQSWWSDDGGRS